jgi:hypothetical protein
MLHEQVGSRTPLPSGTGQLEPGRETSCSRRWNLRHEKRLVGDLRLCWLAEIALCAGLQIIRHEVHRPHRDVPHSIAGFGFLSTERYCSGGDCWSIGLALTSPSARCPGRPAYSRSAVFVRLKSRLRRLHQFQRMRERAFADWALRAALAPASLFPDRREHLCERSGRGAKDAGVGLA